MFVLRGKIRVPDMKAKSVRNRFLEFCREHDIEIEATPGRPSHWLTLAPYPEDDE